MTFRPCHSGLDIQLLSGGVWLTQEYACRALQALHMLQLRHTYYGAGQTSFEDYLTLRHLMVWLADPIVRMQGIASTAHAAAEAHILGCRADKL